MSAIDRNSYRFEFTSFLSDVRRPLINILLRHSGRSSLAIPAILDTGADRCLFDHELALSIGMNPFLDGMEGETTGIGGTEPIAIAPIEIVVPALRGSSWLIFAQFKRLPVGAPAILGHAGFLGRMHATFERGREFELSNVKTD